MPTLKSYRQKPTEDGAEMLINIHDWEGEMDCGDSDEDNLQTGDKWKVEDVLRCEYSISAPPPLF